MGSGESGKTAAQKQEEEEWERFLQASEPQKQHLKDPNQKDRNNKPLILGGLAGAVGIMVALMYPFLQPALKGKLALPFVPATNQQIALVMQACHRHNNTLSKKEKVGLKTIPAGKNDVKDFQFVDLGSGDGRLVIAAAKEGFPAIGYELNLWLVLYSKYKAWREGVSHRAKFYKRDLWKTDLSRFDNICVFGVKEMMPTLETKLHTEMKPNAILIACRFKLPNWKPMDQKVDSAGEMGLESVWVYQKQ